MSSGGRKIIFSGKDEDFPVFAEQFEAKLYGRGLLEVLLDKIKTPVKTEPEETGATVHREQEEAKLATVQYQVWCELIQCLDKKSILFVRACKPNGTAAWHASRNSRARRFRGFRGR